MRRALTTLSAAGAIIGLFITAAGQHPAPARTTAARTDRVAYCLIDGPRSPASSTLYVTASGKVLHGCPGYKPLPRGTPVTNPFHTPVAFSVGEVEVGDSVVCFRHGAMSLRVTITKATSWHASNKQLTLDMHRLPGDLIKGHCRLR